MGALAVDVEPVVFWDGTDPDPDDLIADWKREVGFVDGDDPGCDGRVGGVHLNGSSGATLAAEVLRPKGFELPDVWMSDVEPWFQVKFGTPTKRQQGDVLRDIYNPFAAASGRRPAASLPRRLTPKALVAHAISEERERLRSELLESAAPIVLTLGEEARQILLEVVDAATGLPTSALNTLDYGRPGWVDVSGRTMEWIALVHPGQRASRWVEAHRVWAAS